MDNPGKAFFAALPTSISRCVDSGDVARHLRDFTPVRPQKHDPLAVVYPRTVQEVSAVMTAASDAGLDVVTQGGLTGMSGGALPSKDCIVLSTEKLRGIEEIDLAADTMTVSAGTPLQLVQEAASENGRFFALDFGSRGSCTIGGAIATNAGGNRVLRFGMMRDLVLGIEVVLADGTVMTALNKMMKNNAGFDLRNLFIGSEGALGVVTRAVLKLHPKPTSCQTVLAAVANSDKLYALLAHARKSLGGQLSAFEVMWQDFYRLTHEVSGRSPLSPDSGSHFVLLETLGANEEADNLVFQSFLETAVEQDIVVDAAVAQSVSDAQAFWKIRDSSGELSHLWAPVVNFDVSVPVSRAQEFTIECRAALLKALPDTDVVFFGHLADSNMHLAVKDPQRQWKAMIDSTVYEVVRSFSGSVSAEHGIGLDKREYLGHSRSPEELMVMGWMKKVLDPGNRLNPGKVLPAAVLDSVYGAGH